jgi:hypothetical protein
MAAIMGCPPPDGIILMVLYGIIGSEGMAAKE